MIPARDKPKPLLSPRMPRGPAAVFLKNSPRPLVSLLLEVGTCVVERVPKAQATSSSQSPRGRLDQGEAAKLGSSVVEGRKLLDRVLESEGQALSGGVTKHVDEIPLPETHQAVHSSHRR